MSVWLLILGNCVLPWLVAGGIIWFLLHRHQGVSIEKVLKNPARPLHLETTFGDVGGYREAVDEMRGIISTFNARLSGMYPPRGVLLTGEPGTGKTLLAHAAGGVAGVSFFEVSGPELVEMLVGSAASRIRALFVQAREKSPCIVFVDCLDVIGRQRTAADRLAEGRQSLGQLCIELDSLTPSVPVLVIGATNRPDLLDPALLRSGRLEHRIHLPRPDVGDRELILGVHTRHRSLSMEVNLGQIAAEAEGFVGADLARLANEAALCALRDGRAAITQDDFETAIQRVAQTVHRLDRDLRSPAG